MKYLSLWLEANLQSWGYDSKFSNRTTFSFPTKSGIYGLLLCSMGRGGEQKELLAELRECRTTVIEYSKNENSFGLLNDFHLIGNGYDPENPWEMNMILKKKNGGIPSIQGTKITHRQYLQDATFGVIQEIPDGLASETAESLQTPVWPIYLGRKCCAPTYPVYQGVSESFEDAVTLLDRISLNKGLRETRRLLDGSFDTEGDVMSICDVPVRFGIYKEYEDRFVTIRR